MTSPVGGVIAHDQFRVKRAHSGTFSVSEAVALGSLSQLQTNSRAEDASLPSGEVGYIYQSVYDWDMNGSKSTHCACIFRHPLVPIEQQGAR